MSILVKKNETLGETLYEKTLSSGVKCYIIPKSGFKEKQAFFAVGYGSNDNMYLQGEGRVTSPLGTAHFIEHKLFEEEWGNIFDSFSALGGEANAFTDCNKTAYYFSCKDNFTENFKTLLQFVQSPYFTEESTKREKGIIGQEITMFDDDPYWQVYYAMLENLYKNHSIRYSIAGCSESIRKITKDTLYDCYHAFYNSANMAIVCIGDIQTEATFQLAESLCEKSESERVKTYYEEEPEQIVKPYSIRGMEISKPVFQIGYKEKPYDPMPSAETVYGIKMLLDLLAGEGSDLFYSLYKKRLLTEEMGLQFLYGDGFAFIAFSGVSDVPKTVCEKLTKEIERLRREGIPEDAFQRIKKKHIGRFIRGFHSINAIATTQLDMAFKNMDLMDAFDAICAMKLETLTKLLNTMLQEKQQTLAVVQRQ